MSNQPAPSAPASSDSPGAGGATRREAGGGPQQGSMLTVLVALVANALIAVAKSVAAVLTGSASMVAEAAHSWADAGNEVFLMIAERRSAKAPDGSHPLGYGRDGYVWSMFAAIGLFTAGAVVSVYHGIHELGQSEAESDYRIAYLVLGVAFLLEGVSFLQARREAAEGARKRQQGLLRFVSETSNPTLRAVFFEDAAALVGLVIAFAGILAHQLTGNAMFDALGSILVGLLLGVLAIFLISRNVHFLSGQVVNPQVRRTVLARMLEHPEIQRVTYLHIEYVGADRVYLVAAVDLVGDELESHVALTLRRLEAEIQGHDLVQQAILTLSAPQDVAIQP